VSAPVFTFRIANVVGIIYTSVSWILLHQQIHNFALVRCYFIWRQAKYLSSYVNPRQNHFDVDILFPYMNLIHSQTHYVHFNFNLL